MKTSRYIVYFGVLLFSFSFSKKQIKTETKIDYEVYQKFEELILGPDFEIINEYDTDGNLIKSSNYLSDEHYSNFGFRDRSDDNEVKVWERNKNGKVVNSYIYRKGLGSINTICNWCSS